MMIGRWSVWDILMIVIVVSTVIGNMLRADWRYAGMWFLVLLLLISRLFNKNEIATLKAANSALWDTLRELERRL